MIKTSYWSFIPRRGSGRRSGPRGRWRTFVARPRSSGPAPACCSSREELTALFAETRPEAIEDMRDAADELRAELAGETVTFVVNRNINVSNVCIVGCAFCGFGQGKRSPDAYEHSREEFATRVADARRVRRDRDLHAVGHPPRLGARGLRGLAALRQGAGAAAPPARLLPMEVAHMCDVSGLSPRAVFARLREAGLDSTPGHRRRGAPRRRARAHQPEQAAGRALGRDHRGQPRARACARP